MTRRTPIRMLAALMMAWVLLSPSLAVAQMASSDAPAPPAVTVPPVADDPQKPGATPIVDLKINSGPDGAGYVTAIKIFMLLTALTLAPAILMSVTSFTRIVVVLSLLKQAVGVQNLPPSRIVVGIALFMSMFTMSPVLHAIDVNALTPWEAGEINGKEAAHLAMDPLRRFMLAHTRTEDLQLFVDLSGAQQPNTLEDLSTFTLIPAFMTSELKTSFQMGAMLFLPFLVIDLVVASVLMSMGMMMLPPVMVSLPLKLFIFVLADGWGLVLHSLAESVMIPLSQTGI